MSNVNVYNWEHVKRIRMQPHLLGLLAGKDLLTPMHSKWMRYLLDSTEERVLQAHRGAFKTTAISEIGVIWYLMFHPNARVAIIRKTYTDAAAIVRTIANLMMTPEIYDLLTFAWGEPWHFTIRREGKLELSVKKTQTKEVSVTALGIDSGITGQHYDWAVSDDACDLKDRISESEREKTKLVIQEFRSNIMDRGKHMVHIGTPWDRHDMFSILPPALKFPLGTTGLITPEQEALIRSRTTPILFAVNYKLEFENESDMLFRDPYMGKWHSDDLTNIRAHVDAAFDGEHFCALTIMGRRKSDGKLNAVGFAYPGNVKEWLGFIAQKIAHYGGTRLCMEENADKGYTADILKTNPIVKQNHIWIDTYHESMQKELKIATYLHEVWKDIEWAMETDPEYLEQCIDWRPKMEPDDAPDSAASLIREANFSATKTWNSGLWRW